jgi:quercetin dioxygenase-like cupin family protein
MRKRRRNGVKPRASLFCSLVGTAALLPWARPASAVNRTVTTLNDSGPGSLRDTIDDEEAEGFLQHRGFKKIFRAAARGAATCIKNLAQSWRVPGGISALGDRNTFMPARERCAGQKSQPGKEIKERKEKTMNALTQFKKTPILPLLIALALVVGAALMVVPAVATLPSGVMTEIIAVGRFDEIDVSAKTGKGHDKWKARIDTKGESDLHVLQNTIAPGGTFGWHSHPGPSLVIVKSGTATVYMAHDPSCTPHVFPAGSGFVDSGGDVHTVRNEGTVDLVTVVASLIPAGAERRIDEPAPGNCPF